MVAETIIPIAERVKRLEVPNPWNTSDVDGMKALCNITNKDPEKDGLWVNRGEVGVQDTRYTRLSMRIGTTVLMADDAAPRGQANL